MNCILHGKPMFLLTVILCVALTVSCNWQSGETEKEISKTEMTTQTPTHVKMSITGMTCMACVASVKNAIEELEGVEKVEVSLEENQAIVTYFAVKIEPGKLQEAVNKKGFKASKPEELKE